MILCDTNIFIDFFNGDTKTKEQLERIGFDKIVMSAITYMELCQGAGNKHELKQIEKNLKYYDIINCDEKISEISINLFKKYNLSHNLQIPDAIIGATCIARQIPLFTYNLKDFKFMPNINLYGVT